MRLKFPEGISAASAQFIEIKPDADGTADVPDAIYHHFLEVGFTIAGPSVATKEPIPVVPKEEEIPPVDPKVDEILPVEPKEEIPVDPKADPGTKEVTSKKAPVKKEAIQ